MQTVLQKRVANTTLADTTDWRVFQHTQHLSSPARAQRQAKPSGARKGDPSRAKSARARDAARRATMRPAKDPRVLTAHVSRQPYGKQLLGGRAVGWLRRAGGVCAEVTHLRVHALLDVGLALAQELAREQHNARRAIADLRILRHGDLHERDGGGVHDLQQLHERRAVVRDGHRPLVVVDELVHAALIDYPRYVSRDSGWFITAEQAIEELVAWRAAPPQRRTLVQALFRHWGRLRRR